MSCRAIVLDHVTLSLDSASLCRSVLTRGSSHRQSPSLQINLISPPHCNSILADLRHLRCWACVLQVQQQADGKHARHSIFFFGFVLFFSCFRVHVVSKVIVQDLRLSPHADFTCRLPLVDSPQTNVSFDSLIYRLDPHSQAACSFL